MSSEKSNLHPRNLHRNSYDFDSLISCVPELKHYVYKNPCGNFTINFSIPKAVKLLNKALLQHFYGIKNWDIPDGNLCPPIPGRADYVHYIADLLAGNHPQIPTGFSVKGLDIGTGANLVYPLIAHQSYRWRMVGTDINKDSFQNAQHILQQNPDLLSEIKLRFQENSNFIFKNIVSSEDKFAFSMCNPPFHDSEESALKGNLRKTKNLSKSKLKNPNLNFSGQQSELWCEGGEIAFVSRMIEESTIFSSQVLWFTCLVSKKENLFKLNTLLNKLKAAETKTIEMSQGQKVSRILAWTFIRKENRKGWF
ncbi:MULTISPECIES: 23S rRNA (adenine(1618)-N(6))-methyltransferase RlmF [Chryseobacterium]|uniref:Ribosomal RNA large subunit methyltransferase F n=1 Tax=Chryseobacterium taihuense TaxID=1141221 RepID=A0A4U8WA57_9FLAO|nr:MULTISPECIES: 23S rRNA (adenine(1618)-N(6))-methyltransferase RlmF [Chryseobacterium]QQV03717.1 23S rRNA (adenine(1618)-N(6))-methyltransferase RlmF [Chryseobacterium sp. FDAARGOS 1104]VFB02943.1 Ribosomal RNA large subunit methyltransferase F [Chryseobacterium taihuense]